MGKQDIVLDGDVGPELEAYVNALLDRIRELEEQDQANAAIIKSLAMAYAKANRKLEEAGHEP